MFTQNHPLAFLNHIRRDYDYTQLSLIQKFTLYLEYQQDLHNNRDPEFINKFRTTHFCHSFSILMGIALNLQDQPVSLDEYGRPKAKLDAVRLWSALTRLIEWTPHTHRPLYLLDHPPPDCPITNIAELSTEDDDFERIIGHLFGTQYRNEYLKNQSDKQKISIMLSDSKNRILERTDTVVLPTYQTEHDKIYIKHTLEHLLVPYKFLILTDVNNWHDILIVYYHGYIIFWNVNDPQLLIYNGDEFNQALQCLFKNLDFTKNIFTISAYTQFNASIFHHPTPKLYLNAFTSSEAFRAAKEGMRAGCVRSMRFFAEKVSSKPDQYELARLSIIDGYFGVLADLLQTGLSANRIVSVKTLLEQAAESPHSEIFNLVLQRALSEVTTTNTEDPELGEQLQYSCNLNRALLKAALAGQTENCALLINHGASVDLLTAEGIPLLQAVVENGLVKTAQLLLNHGAHHGLTSTSTTLYDIALLNENEDMVRCLINFGLVPSSSLSMAVNLGSTIIVKLLLQSMVFTNEIYSSAVLSALKNQQVAIAQLLLPYTNNQIPTLLNQPVETLSLNDLLYQAVAEKKLITVSFLLDKGAEATAPLNQPQPFNLAVMQNNVPMVALLLKHIRDPKKIYDARLILYSPNVNLEIKKLILERFNASFNYNAFPLEQFVHNTFFTKMHSSSPSFGNNSSKALTYRQT